MRNSEPQLRYTVASDSELDELLAGREAGVALLFTTSSGLQHLSPGSTGVVWVRGDQSDDPVRPLLLIVNESDVRRLCGRYAQLRSDLSPLTAWCHLITPRFFELLDSPVREPELAGLEAAWTGLAIAESVLLSEKPPSALRISACLATQSFAIARTRAVWPDVSIDQVVDRFDSANRLCRSERSTQKGDLGARKLRSSLRPIWTSLLELSADGGSTSKSGPIVQSLEALRRARSLKDPHEARSFASPLFDLGPEADKFVDLSQLTPEMRLRMFDGLVDNMEKARRDPVRQTGIALLAGYLATIAAGGAPSLSLAEEVAGEWPEITAWAYVVGGIGERVVWTSSFDGLGRLVAREILRPFRCDESPTCDFAFEECNVLADAKLPDPLVHLKVKQARVISVALFPGVNVSIPINEIATREGPKTARPTDSTSQINPLPLLSDALWPYLRARIAEMVKSELRGESDESQSGSGKRKSGYQLPFNPRK